MSPSLSCRSCGCSLGGAGDRFRRIIDNRISWTNPRRVRAFILTLSFIPFLYYGAKDNVFHFRGRKVSRSEHLLHAVIGLTLAIMFVHALQGHHLVVLGALLLFVVGGSVDEYIYHRDIPAVESDLHAKEHLALLIFVV